MKHQRSLISIAMVTLVLLSLCAVCVSSTSVSAAGGSSSRATVQQSAALVGATVVGAPAVCAQDANSLNVFVQGTDHALWHKHYQSGSEWSAWESLGGILTSSPAATSSGSGVVDVAARGSNGALYTRHYSGIWGPWTNLGGQLLAGTGPAATNWGSGRTDWFVTGTNHVLYHSWTGHPGWENLGGYLTSSPGATSPGSNRIDVFVRGGDNGLWRKSYNGGWSGWTSIDDPIAGMIGAMNEANIYSTTDALQNIPTRLYGTAGNGEAAGFLYSKLSGIPGLQVAYEGGSFKNIIGILPGTDTSSKEIVMVGAHYDSISSDPARAPGATDNACGVAIVLELARVMSQHQFNHTIAFALWNAEEEGNQGSNAYVESAVQSSFKIPLYFNYDSSCYDPEGRFILDIKYNSQSSWAEEMMTQDNTLYGINFRLTYNVHTTCSSDHASFWSHGYAAVMTHEETHGPAHTPSDTIDKVSTAYALKNGQLGMAVLAQIAEVRGVAHYT